MKRSLFAAAVFFCLNLTHGITFRTSYATAIIHSIMPVFMR